MVWISILLSVLVFGVCHYLFEKKIKTNTMSFNKGISLYLSGMMFVLINSLLGLVFLF